MKRIKRFFKIINLIPNEINIIIINCEYEFQSPNYLGKRESFILVFFKEQKSTSDILKLAKVEFFFTMPDENVKMSNVVIFVGKHYYSIS